MFSIKREFIRFEDRIVEVVKKYPLNRIKNANGIKELLHCNVVLKQMDTMYFCTTVTDVDFEEIDNQKNPEINLDSPKD